MKAEAFISRLQKAKPLGPGRWIACCPAHEDRTPSMTVRELEDGRVLVHCFGGCSVENILGAVGMSFDALFPDRSPDDYDPALRCPFPAADVLSALRDEIQVLAIIAGDMERKRTISATDMARLELARQRFEAALPYTLGLHLRMVRSVKR